MDGQTVESITQDPESERQWLEALHQELKTNQYRPRPVLRVLIPKNNGSLRPLASAMLVLMPIFEADFHPRSFGFRPKRNAHQAIEEITWALSRGRLEVVDVDFAKYFDTIPQGPLLQISSATSQRWQRPAAHQMWLRAPVQEQDKDGTRRIKPNTSGTPQGGVITPPTQ